jgi:hypothetical protein
MLASPAAKLQVQPGSFEPLLGAAQPVGPAAAEVADACR